MLTQRALVLAKLETTFGVDASPTPTADAVLVESPEYTMEPNILERKFVHPDLSTIAHLVGRKLAKVAFTSELRGNGLGTTGLVANLPKIAVLLQGCGMAATALSGAACAYAPMPSLDNSALEPAIAWAVTEVTPPSWAGLNLYRLTVMTGGASAVASFAVQSTNPALDTTDTSSSPVVVTSGTTSLSLGTSGASVIPTFSGTLVAGSQYYALVVPKSVVLSPISTGFQSITLYLYFDGLLHKMTGAVGTFKISADAGAYPKITFDFIGQYIAPTDTALPTNAVFETTLPPIVQTSGFTWNGNNSLVAAQWTIDMANKVVQRPDINGTDGFLGSTITHRDPSGGFNPEATTLSTNTTDVNAFDDFATSKQKTFVVQAGNVAGNIVGVYGPRAQVAALKYADRDGIRVYDQTVKFRRNQGNDEVQFFFM